MWSYYMNTLVVIGFWEDSGAPVLWCSYKSLMASPCTVTQLISKEKMGRLLLPLALVLSVLVALTTGAAIKGSKSSLSFVSQLRLSQSLELLSSYF